MAECLHAQTTSIPLAPYPEAMRRVAALIDDDKIEEAKVALDTALSTLVVTEEAIPLPLLRAQEMLDAAQAALNDAEGDSGENGDSAESQEDRAVDVASLLENAAYQIELAKAFGYGDRSVYKRLQRDLNELEQRVDGDKDAGELFASLRRQIAGLMPGDGE